MTLVASSSMHMRDLGSSSCRAEGCSLSSFAGILLPFIHLLLELLGLLLIHEAQGSHALLQLKRVEECAILVVLESIVDLLVPYYTAISG